MLAGKRRRGGLNGDAATTMLHRRDGLLSVISRLVFEPSILQNYGKKNYTLVPYRPYDTLSHILGRLMWLGCTSSEQFHINHSCLPARAHAHTASDPVYTLHI